MEHAYKHIEITGTSAESSDQAVRNALEKAGKSLHHIRWFEKIGERGEVEDGEISYWQVTLKIGFRLDD